MMPMPVPVDFWVLRVLLHRGPQRRPVKLEHMTPSALVATLALVKTGEYVCLPDGCICEPVECFQDQMKAHELHSRLTSDNPTHDYRVIMSSGGFDD